MELWRFSASATSSSKAQSSNHFVIISRPTHTSPSTQLCGTKGQDVLLLKAGKQIILQSSFLSTLPGRGPRGLVRRSSLMAYASRFGYKSEHLAQWLITRSQFGGSVTGSVSGSVNAAITLRDCLVNERLADSRLRRDRASKESPGGQSVIWHGGRGSLSDPGRTQQGWPVRSLPAAGLVELVASSSVTAASVSGPHIVATVTQVAVTAAAVVYGAYLSDEMLRGSREPEKPRPLVFEGVDVTDYPIFREPQVQKAIAFAAEAHAGQMRKTGEPYVAHCIHTGRILAALVPSQSTRAIHTVVAGILHDVVDDGGRKLSDVRKEFGDDVMRLVEGVSKLSHINQLLRRHRRTTAEQNSAPIGLSSEDVDSLRMMLLGMVTDPRVVLIKLADRLHNMRTIYALPHAKACAVAQETLAVWCSLASRLGVWAVKAELEDLCFAVLQPKTFRQLRAELAALWTPSSDWRQQRRMKRSKRWAFQAAGYAEDFKRPKDPEDDEDITMRDLLEAVVPFDVLLDRNRRSCGLGQSSSRGSKKPKVVRDAEVALAALALCEEALDKELLITTPYVPGMEVMLSGRLKSVYSAYCKMRRKNVSIDQVYDARALRVVVGDGGGTLNELAVEGCYSLLNVVHSLWTPVGGEFDDYILNPKASGYQSLHTAVTGPDGAALEVQIRTQGMHEYAEFGHAAHWLYKEGDSQDFTIQNPAPISGERQGLFGQGAEASTPGSGQTSFFDVIIGQGTLAPKINTSPTQLPLTTSSSISSSSDLSSSPEAETNEGNPRVVQSSSQSDASTSSSSPSVETLFVNQIAAEEGREPYAGPGLDSEDLRTSGTFGVEDDSDGDHRGRGAAGTSPGRRAGGRENEEWDVEGLLPLLPAKWPIAVGQPALRIEDGRLLAAVVVRVDNNGRDLLVAVSFALHAREAVAAGRGRSQVQRWATYARLLHKVQSRWWNAPGHGDWSTCLEHYTLCKDGIYHKEDQFGRALPTFIQLLELSPDEEREYAEVCHAVEAGEDVGSPQQELNTSSAELAERQEEAVLSAVALLNNKVRLLRSMLQWEQELRHEAATDGSITALDPGVGRSEKRDGGGLSEVLIIRWPGGDILRMPSGSDARDVALQAGLEGCTVLINSKVAMPNTRLRDGDLVEIRG